MYNYYQPQQRMTNTLLRGRPVSSLEEVKASPIDFDGSMFYFPDLANNRIYTKSINMDGTASLNMYELTKMPVEQPQQQFNNFVTKTELEQILTDFKASLQPKVEDKKSAPIPQF